MNTTLDTQALAATIASAVTEAVVAALASAADQPAKVTRPKAAPKARKAPARKAPKAAKPQVSTVKCLVKANRADFVRDNAWARGLSTLDIAIAHVHLGAVISGPWALGEGYEAKARTATKAAIAAVRKAL